MLHTLYHLYFLWTPFELLFQTPGSSTLYPYFDRITFGWTRLSITASPSSGQLFNYSSFITFTSSQT